VKVVAVMTRVPVTPADAAAPGHAVTAAGIKTRLSPVLPDPAQRAALQRAMLADVLAAARAVPGAVVRVAVTPDADPKTLADVGVAPGQVMTQRGECLGDRERSVFADLFRRGAKQVLLVGSDLPLLTTAILEEGFAALTAAPAQVVLGPASDGGYYLLGLTAPQLPDLFTGVRWSSKYTLMDTLRRCEFEERRVAFLPMLDDIDVPEDLARLRVALAINPTSAPHTAAVLASLGSNV
jgi:uncharacterized protein